MLKYKKKQIFEVDYGDFDEFIREQYQQEYDFVVDMESGNDQSHKFNVHKEKLDEYYTNKLQRFKEGGNTYGITRVLLTDLANREVIEEGEYLINVCW